MASEKPVVHVVDDDAAVVRLVAEVLKPTGLNVEGYGSAEKFLDAYRATGPACLVLDVRIPGMSGIELHERLRTAEDPLPIIFITGHADVRMAVEVMEKGAFGLLEKPFRPQELCDKIQRAIRSSQDGWRRRKEREAVDRRLGCLTPAERKVLELIVTGQTNKMIAEGLGVSVRTIEVHRARMQKKLGVTSRAGLLRLMDPGDPL